MSTFAPALRTHLESLDHLGILERRALRICKAPDSPHRTRLLERWEAGSREKLGFDPSAVIDWFKANWQTILQVVLAVLGMLMMFAEPEPTMQADPESMAWAPGDMLWRLIGGKAAAYVRTKWPNFPGTDDELAAFFTAEVKDAMS